MPRRLSLLVPVALLGVVTATVSDVGIAAGQGDEADTAPTAPVVEVIDPGAEPRAPLRYALTAGTSYTATQTIDQKIRQLDDEGFGNTTEVPTIDFGLRLDVQDVQPDGTARVAMAFTSVDATGTGSAASSDQAVAIEIALGDITDLTGTTVMTSRGVPLESSFDVPEGLPEIVDTVIEQLEGQVAALTPPLPEEPLGVGARWRATTEAELASIRFEQSFVYTIDSITGSQVELSVAVRQRAAPQEIDIPNAPRGTKVRLLSYRARGKGSNTIDLATPIPVESEVSLEVVNRVRSEKSNGDTETVRTTSEQEQRITTP